MINIKYTVIIRLNYIIRKVSMYKTQNKIDLMNFEIDIFSDDNIECFDNEEFLLFKNNIKKSNVKNYSYVGMIDGIPTSYIIFENTYISGIILQHIYVKPKYREKGLAKQLFHAAIKKIQDKTKKTKVKKSIIAYYNKELRKFYESLDFIIGSNLEVSIYPLDKIDRLIYRRKELESKT